MSQWTIRRITKDHLNQSPDKFWEELYGYLSPEPSCGFCNEAIDEPREWMAFKCTCPKYYHKACLYKRLNDLSCPECQECKNIYTFAKFPRKFVTRDKYIDIYQKSITNLDPQTQLKMYEYWFHTHDVYNPPLLDLYTYLEPHSPKETMQFFYDNCENLSKYLIESYDPAIIARPSFDETATEIEYDTEKISYRDKKIFVDLDSFRAKFKEYCYDLVGEDFPWNEESVYLVGGTVHKCLESRIKVEDIPEYCDVDIFVCHPDVKVITRETKKIVKYFQTRLGDNIYWLVRRNILNLYVPGYNRSVQIIMFKNTIDNLLHRFDFSHVQYIYNGNKILTTLAGLKYASLLVSVHSGYYDVNFPKRYYKAKKLKLCLALPTDKVLYSRIPQVTSLDYWYPTYTDNLERIQQQLKTIYRVNKKYITQTKPFKIYWYRIPEEFNTDRLSPNCSLTSDGEVIGYIEDELLFPTYS